MAGLSSKIQVADTPLTHSFGGTVDTMNAPAPSADPAAAAGPTSFWQRIQQAGIVQAAAAANKAARDIPLLGGVVSGVEGIPGDIADSAKTLAKPFQQPTKGGPSGSDVMKLQANFNSAVKAGKVSSQTVNLMKSAPASARLQAMRMVGTSSDQQIQQFLDKQTSAETSTELKRAGAGLDLASYAMGGGELKQGIKQVTQTGAKALFKNAVKTGIRVAPAGAVQAASSEVRDTGKVDVQTAESAAAGAVGGFVAGTVGSIAGAGVKKLFSAISGKLITKGEAETAQQLAKQATKVPVTDESTPTMVNVKRPNAPKLLGPGDSTVHGDSFTMKSVPDTQKVKLSARLNTINKQLNQTAQGKIALHPDEVKALITEKQNIGKIARGEMKYEDVYGSKSKTTTPAKVTRPAAKLQAAIEQAHNAGDTAKEAELVKQLPDQGMNPNARLSADAKAKLVQEARQKAGVSAPEAPQAALKPQTAGVSGSALKAEQRAVQAHLASEFEDKATYAPSSYKAEAEKAVKLVQEHPEQAKAIATGAKAADNPVHEVAVRRAVERQAIANGDVETLRQLAASESHVKTSEAAQRLGAEAYNADPTSPVKALRTVADTRAKAFEDRTGQKVGQAVRTETGKIKASMKPPSRTEWQLFVESIKC